MHLSEILIKAMRLLYIIMRLIISGLFKEVWPRLSKMATLTLESVIRGHHIYKSRWTPLL